jgi:hypothetical protein
MAGELVWRRWIWRIWSALLLGFLLGAQLPSRATASSDAPRVTGFRGVAEGQTLSGSVSAIQAQVEGNSIARVRFVLEAPGRAPWRHTEYGAPFFFPGDDTDGTFSWDTTSWPNGSYRLTATAVDEDGREHSEAVRFRVSNAEPPPSGPTVDGFLGVYEGQTLGGRVVSIRPLLRDTEIDHVRFLLEAPGREPWSSTVHEEPYYFSSENRRPASWDTTSWPNGNYRLTATAVDEDGREHSESVQFIVDNSAAPFITGFEGLSEGQHANGDVSIQALVRGTQINHVHFALLGPGRTPWWHTEYGAPFFFPGNDDERTFKWDTTSWPDGEYSLTVSAVDKDERVGSAVLRFVVDNIPDTGEPTPTPIDEPGEPTPTPIDEPGEPTPTPIDEPGEPLPPGSLTSHRPEAIPLDANEIVNPGRGFYDRYIYEDGVKAQPVPLPEPAHDAYVRVYWNELEGPQPGRYNFDAIFRRANMIAQGNDEGRVPGKKIGFRVVLLESDDWNERTPDGSQSPCCLPRYIIDGRMAHRLSDGRWMPNWDDSELLDHIDRMLLDFGDYLRSDKAIAQRIGFIEIGVYGAWGEWHLHGYSDLHDWERVRKRIADAHLKAFYNFQLLAMTDEPKALDYLMRQTSVTLDDGTVKPLKPIGLRRDSHGTTHFWRFSRCESGTNPAEEGCKDSDYPGLWERVRDRWKVAPFIVEYFFNDRFDYALAREQVEQYHVAMVTNGKPVGAEFCGRASFRTFCEQPRTLLPIGMRAGYRYVISELGYTAQVEPGGELGVRTLWQNHGVAPTYEDWAVHYQLRRSDGRVAWSGVSRVRLRSVLPSETQGGKAPQLAVEDRLSLPTSLAPGRYELNVQILDPQNYRQPLIPAVKGVRADGSYRIGEVTVR